MSEAKGFYRPQIYFQRKDEIEALEKGFGESGAKSRSAYLHDLVMLGLESEGGKQENDQDELLAEIRSFIGTAEAAFGALPSGVNEIETGQGKEESDVAILRKDVSGIKSQLDSISKEIDVMEKALANVYQFTYPKIGAPKKAIESGELDELPGRLRR